jgi:hypothetical protein
MNLPLILSSLATTIRNPKYTAEYVRVRAFERVLEPYEAPTALADALAKAPQLTDERQLVVRALLRAHQGSPVKHPLWQALLLRAFEPMLKRLRGGLRADSDDCDQQVLLAFLEAIARINPDASAIFLTVRRATARRVFGELRAEREHEDLVQFDEESVECSPPPHLDPQPFVHCLAHEVADMLVELPGGMEAVRAAVANDTIAEQVEELGESKKVTRACLQRRSHRALKRVRGKLSDEGSG